MKEHEKSIDEEPKALRIFRDSALNLAALRDLGTRPSYFAPRREQRPDLLGIDVCGRDLVARAVLRLGPGAENHLDLFVLCEYRDDVRHDVLLQHRGEAAEIVLVDRGELARR